LYKTYDNLRFIFKVMNL